MRKVFNIECSWKYGMVLTAIKNEGKTEISVNKLRSLSKENFNYVFPDRTLKKMAESVGLRVVRNSRKKRECNGRGNTSNAVMVATLVVEFTHVVADLATMLGIDHQSDEMKRLRAIYTGMRMVCNRRPVEEIESFIEKGYLSASKLARTSGIKPETNNV